MRMTARLPARLIRRAKAHAVRTRRTSAGFTEESFGRAAQVGKPAYDRSAYRVPTFSSQVRPGVDLDSNAATLEAMEG